MPLPDHIAATCVAPGHLSTSSLARLGFVIKAPAGGFEIILPEIGPRMEFTQGGE